MSNFQAKEFKQFMDSLRQQTGLIRSFVTMSEMPEAQKNEALRLHEENEARLTAALEVVESANESNFNQHARDFKTAFNQYFAHIKVMIRESIGTMRMFPPVLLEQFESAIDEMHHKMDGMIKD